MSVVEALYIAIIPLLGAFLTIGGYVLQRDKYWRRVWIKMGKPQVESIKELKELMKERQSYPVPDGKQRELISEL